MGTGRPHPYRWASGKLRLWPRPAYVAADVRTRHPETLAVLFGHVLISNLSRLDV
jgi:hypothetical protein